MSPAEIKAVEERVDRFFDEQSLPTGELNSARWIVCTVSEDLQRFMLIEAAKTWHQKDARTDRGRFIGIVDNSKYQLRHALDLCARRLTSTGQEGRIETNGDNYGKAAKLLDVAKQYADATRLFSSTHAGDSTLQIDRDGEIIEPVQDPHVGQYGTMEFLLHADREDAVTLFLVIALFSGPFFDLPTIDSVGGWAPEIHEIVKRTRVRHGRVNYRLRVELADGIFQSFLAPPTSLLDGWEFPWASVAQVRRYFAGLQAICLYHLLAVHFGASKESLRGVGLDQICLDLSVDVLDDQIGRLAKLPIDVVKSITRVLTFGYSTTTPDPALQPLIPIGRIALAIPCMLILSSNWARNMLSLHARVSPKTFDARSAIFEKRMIGDLIGKVPDRFRRAVNRTIQTGVDSEEVDLVLADHEEGTILIAELRWMIQPGDVREVINRKREMRKKVRQAERKLNAILSSIDEVANQLELPVRKDWKVRAIVLVEGFGGLPSQIPNVIPIVPTDVFIEVLRADAGLDHAHAILCAPIWLPRADVDYISKRNETTICGVAVKLPTFDIGPQSYTKVSLPLYISEALKLTPEKLRSEEW